MSLYQDEECHKANNLMVDVPPESDQSGFEAVVGKDGTEMEKGDPQKEENERTLVDLGKRKKKLTEKGVSFKLSTLLSKGNRMNSRLLRQSSVIQVLMYSAKNMVTVEEEIAQFDYIFKQLLLVHQGINHCWLRRKSQLMKNGLRRWMNMFSPLNIRFTAGSEMQRWNVQTHI